MSTDHGSQPDAQKMMTAAADAVWSDEGADSGVVYSSTIPASAALVLTWVGAGSIGIGAQGLAAVSVTRAGATYPAHGWTLSQTVITGVTALGLVLFTGFRRRPVGRFDGVAITGGAWLLGWVWLFSELSSAFEFGGPTYPDGPVDTCVYASCWPSPYQGIALAMPVVVAVLAAVAMATLGRRLSWWIRATVPAAVLIAATLLQVTTWDRYVIPLFEGPSPFS